MLPCLRLRPLALVAAVLLFTPVAAPAAPVWSGSITCTLKYAGRTAAGAHSLDEVQRWVLGAVTGTSGPRTFYAVTFRDRGTLVEPIGQWTVAPKAVPLTMTLAERYDGATLVDRNVVSGAQPPGLFWTGTVPRPHPKKFPAIEFDFLSITIPPGVRTFHGQRLQGTVPPSYYQLAKAIPGRSTCAWAFSRP
jgi:hypothetical protein